MLLRIYKIRKTILILRIFNMAAIPGYDTKERHTHATLAAALAAAYQTAVAFYTHCGFLHSL